MACRNIEPFPTPVTEKFLFAHAMPLSSSEKEQGINWSLHSFQLIYRVRSSVRTCKVLSPTLKLAFSQQFCNCYEQLCNYSYIILKSASDKQSNLSIAIKATIKIQNVRKNIAQITATSDTFHFVVEKKRSSGEAITNA